MTTSDVTFTKGLTVPRKLWIDKCSECAGMGKVHSGCTGMTYQELAEEAMRLRDAIEDVRAMVDK